MAQGQQGQIADVVGRVDNLLQTYVTSTAADIATEVGQWSANLMAVYLIFMGLFVMYGYVELEMRDLLRRLALPGFLVTFVLAYGSVYQTWFVQPFMEIPNHLASLIAVGNQGGGGSLASLVDDLWKRLWEVINAIWQNGEGFTYPAIIIFVTLIVSLPTIFLITALIMLAKIAIAVLLAVGPLFIIAMLFGPTRRLFETWLQQLMAFAVLQVLLGAIGGLIYRLANAYSQAVNVHSNLTFYDLSGLLLVYGVSFILLTMIPGIAQSIGGGMGMPAVDSLKQAGKGTGAHTLGGAAKSRWQNRRRRERPRFEA